jgi:hypothetical protein
MRGWERGWRGIGVKVVIRSPFGVMVDRAGVLLEKQTRIAGGM